MLRLRFWKPAPGVRSFLIELLIVVLGVLIALGAQQAVEAYRARDEVANFRAALDREVARNLALYSVRVRQGPCLRKKLADLESWHGVWSDGGLGAPAGVIGRPLAAPPNFAVWRAGAQSAASLMPLEMRLRYTQVYSGLEIHELIIDREAAAWRDLAAYDGATQLSPQELNQLRGAILAAKWTDWSIDQNWPILLRHAAALGIGPQRLPRALVDQRVAASKLCEDFDGRAN